MQIGLNVAVLDNTYIPRQFPLIHNNLDVVPLELPVQLCQIQKITKSSLKGLTVCGLSGLLSLNEVLPMSIFVPEREFLIQLNYLEDKIQICNDLGCQNMSIGIDPYVDIKVEYADKIFIERVRHCAQKAARENININLEYISYRVAYNNGDVKKFLYCDSIGRAITLIQNINLNNVNLLLDFLHWYCDNKKMCIKNIIDFIGFIHICDHTQKAYNKISDRGRLLPGQGNLPLYSFLSDIKYYGYRNPLTIEVFRTNKYKPSYREIKRSLLYTGKLLQ